MTQAQVQGLAARVCVCAVLAGEQQGNVNSQAAPGALSQSDTQCTLAAIGRAASLLLLLHLLSIHAPALYVHQLYSAIDQQRLDILYILII
jgi:hypothetical protein